MSSAAQKVSPAFSLAQDQDAAVTRLVEHDHTLLYAGMGAGKTVVALTAIDELLQDGVLSRVLVVAPLKVARATWPAEAASWPHLARLKLGLAVGDAATRSKIIEDTQHDVVVINHDVLGWASERYSLPDLFDGLVVDEVGALSETGGARFKKFRRHILKFAWRVGLTGTPVEEGLDKLFGQMLVVDGGAALGRNKQRYLDRYFVPTDWERRNWAPREGAVGEVATRIKNVVYSMPSYTHELPPLRVHWEEHVMPPEVRAVYDELRHNLCWGEVECANQAVLTGKLLQVCNGFVYTTPEDEGKSAQWVDIHDERRNWCYSFLDHARDEPLLVVYWWQAQQAWLRDRGVPFFDERKHLAAWNSGDLPLLAIHPRSCGHGLNLQHGGRRMLWLGPQWSLALHEQVVARLWRRGQTREVEVVIPFMRDSMEDIARARLDGKRDWVALFNRHVPVAS